MSTPKAGSPEWQEQLTREVEARDKAARESGNEGQTFEISGGAK